MKELTFSEDFFKGEEIDGFFVEEMMKRTWAAETKVLCQLDEVCRRNNITYFVAWGTLLGAVRHHGFIPWDDDIDIVMPRADYMKLMKLPASEFPANISISSMYHNPDHNQPFSAIMNRSTVWEDKDLTEEYYGCPFIVGMDVCVLDYIPRDKELANVHKLLYRGAYDLAQNYYKYEKNGNAESLLAQMEGVSGTKIDRSGNIRNNIWKLADSILMMFTEEESDMMVYETSFATHEPPIELNKECFSDVVELPFTGGITVPAPVGYLEFLTKVYGENYMTPIISAGHDYPFYKMQLEYLHSIGIEI